MRKRKSGSAPRSIGFPLILAGIAVYYFINQKVKADAARVYATGSVIREEDAVIARGGIFPH